MIKNIKHGDEKAVERLGMFIKFGEEEHLIDLKERGEIFFNPCQLFREIEKEQKEKGFGDKNDGGIHAVASRVKMSEANDAVNLEKTETSIVTERALHTPIFCMRKSYIQHITADYREKLRREFPKHTHALIIKDESAFLEDIRYHLKSKAFAHSVYYGDQLTEDFLEFLISGGSDISFYSTKRKGQQYYMKMIFKSEEPTVHNKEILIDDSNFYKSMYKKDLYFQEQFEYRIVLPHEKIEAGKKYNINPVDATLCSIDELVK